MATLASRQAAAVLVHTLLLSACSRDAAVSRQPPHTFDCLDASPVASWVPGHGEHLAVTGTFGGDEDQWLQGPRGLTYGDSKVWVFDGERGYLWRLSEALDSARIVASQGDGPGELAVVRPPMFGDWITSGPGSDLLTVFDGRSLHSFDTGGSFVARTPAPPAGLSPFAVRRVVRIGRDMLYGTAVSSLSEAGRMEVWRSGGEETHLLLTIELPIGPGIASPLWDVAGDCLVAVNGRSPWIYRTHLTSGAIDSLPLPLYEPPADRAEDVALQDARLREIAAMGGRAMAEAGTRRASFLWTGVRADPEGFIWVRGWRPPSYDALGDTVFAVHPDGRQVSFAAPAFPDAFGEYRNFYGFGRDVETGVPFVLGVSVTHR